eukprot:5872745-Pleurochrysis_carterae.AAC.3
MVMSAEGLSHLSGYAPSVARQRVFWTRGITLPRRAGASRQTPSPPSPSTLSARPTPRTHSRGGWWVGISNWPRLCSASPLCDDRDSAARVRGHVHALFKVFLSRHVCSPFVPTIIYYYWGCEWCGGIY